ncbi:hypothetical protein OAX78_02800, partial [Planctomycetota bacterium]|nr:hypothetical protein [Planctomycetota bacterium]
MLTVLLVQSLGGTRRVALAVGVLFAVHPVHTEAVTSIVGRAELLCALFFLLAVLLHRRVPGLPGARAWAARAGVAVCAFLALLSKEHAALLLPTLLALDWIAPAENAAAEPVVLRGRIGDLLWPLIPLLAYLAIRHAVLGPHAWGPGYVTPLDNPLVPPVTSVLGITYGATGGERVLTATALIGTEA